MQIKEVISTADKKAWHKFQRDFYRNDPNFSAPFEKMVEAIFTPGKNEFYENGAATRFLLYDDNQQIIGRTAAFVNGKKAYTFQQPTGGMGFFECIDDQQAANMLFDACRDWLQNHGMQAMDGPINFGENDNYWGLLVEGFSASGWGMNYNPPYYKKLFENYGFKLYFEQVSNLLDYTKPFPERFWKVANWVRSKPEYSCRHLEMKKVERYMHDMKEVYDDAWRFHENFVPLQTETMRKELREGKGLIDERMIWFAYCNDEPIAFLVMIPDASPIFRKFDGKLTLINKLRFLWMKRRHVMTRTRLTIMGIKPRYQRAGIESLLFWHLNEVMKKLSYTHLELSWVGDFNPKMRALHENVGAEFHQRHYTYRILFDENREFERSSIIAKDTREKYLKEEGK
ncbi:MAG: hypothetical protein NC048_08640 [Bacteroides sp.]|nr:hypothetical protein [Ruminococcus flavefaciens]MCM1555546.1 hypothetical protein [Bacteroides sp.]